MLSRFLVVLIAVSASLPLSAQAPAPAPERRTIAVSVLDKDGKAVHGLTAENFRGEFRGQPVRILSATEDSSPRRIYLLVDTSRGMFGVWRFVWGAAEDLVLKLTPEHQIAVVRFDLDAKQLSGFSNDQASLLQALRTSQKDEAVGGTALYDTVLRAGRSFSSPAFGDAVYVITDGQDTASRYTLKEAQTDLASNGVRVFAFWVKPQPVQYGFPAVDRTERLVRDLTQATGGSYLATGRYTEQEVADRVRSLYVAITNMYRLEVEFPQRVDKPRDWTLEVIGADGKKLEDVEVARPRLLVPLTEKK